MQIVIFIMRTIIIRTVIITGASCNDHFCCYCLREGNRYYHFCCCCYDDDDDDDHHHYQCHHHHLGEIANSQLPHQPQTTMPFSRHVRHLAASAQKSSQNPNLLKIGAQFDAVLAF